MTHLLFKSGKPAFHINTLFPSVDSVMLCGNNISGACNGGDPVISSKIVALHYGFLDGAGFSTALSELQEAGVPTVGLCVGTAAWNSLAGSPKSMLSNVVNAHQEWELLCI